MRSNVRNVVVATADELFAAQLRRVANGEQLRRDKWVEGALGNSGLREGQTKWDPSLRDPHWAADIFLR